MVPVVPACSAGEVGRAARPSDASDRPPVIRSLYIAARERRWNRDRRRRIASMLERERLSRMADFDLLEAMAIQLAEIRTLPEVAKLR